jgi:peptidoglycan/xylan/chitin deacetylase (PgdA/CDA1 family)
MSKKMTIKIIIASLLLAIIILILPSFLIVPKIILVGDKEITITMNKEFLEPGYHAEMIGKDISKKVKVEGNVDTNKPGIYEIKYIVSEDKKTTIVIRKVKVIDDIKPEIVLTSGDNIYICPNEEYQELGYTATDNYDGDITSKVTTKRKDNKITYSVEDSSHNKTSVTRTINNIDKEAPVINLKGDSTITFIKGSKYIEYGYSVSDNCANDLNNKVQITNNININATGTYKVEYTVSDDSGNKGTATRTVKIINPPAPKNSTIYLTFDDGPSEITPKVLDILKEEGVKATFFVLNKSSSYDYLLRRIVNEGHTIALHGNSHDYYRVYSSVETYLNDIETIRNKIKNITGVDTRIMRFVGGSSNAVSKFNPGIMTILTKEVTDRGYIYYDWNISSGDTTNISSSQVYNNVIKGLGSKATYIVLMHDMKARTANALRDIIRYGKNHGYRFDRITESTPQIKHGVNN